MFKRSEKTFSVSRYCPTLEIFDVKRNIVSEISKEKPNDNFATFCGSCPVKNISDNRLNPGEFQIDGKHISTRQIKF